MSDAEPTPSNDRELVLTRVYDVPAASLFRCWSEPDLLTQWWAPKPWETPSARLDVRPGGVGTIVMRGPDGTEFPNTGVYLEVVPGRRIVMTDAFVDAWTPSAKPFMTVTVTFDDLADGRTRYTARVGHWTVEDRESHEKMGFHQGWGVCADQMAALAAQL